MLLGVPPSALGRRSGTVSATRFVSQVPLGKTLPSISSATSCPILFGDFSGVGSEEASLRAGLCPPLNLHSGFLASSSCEYTR